MEVFQGLKKLGVEERSLDFKFSFSVKDEAEASKKKKKNKKSKKKKKFKGLAGTLNNVDCEASDSGNENEDEPGNIVAKSPEQSISGQVVPSKQLSSTQENLLQGFSVIPTLSSAAFNPSTAKKNKSNKKKKNKASSKVPSSSSNKTSAKEDIEEDWEAAIAESLRLNQEEDEKETNKAVAIALTPNDQGAGDGGSGGGPSILSSRHDSSIDSLEKMRRRFGQGKSLVKNDGGLVKIRDSNWLHHSTDSVVVEGEAIRQQFHSSAFTFSFDGLS